MSRNQNVKQAVPTKASTFFDCINDTDPIYSDRQQLIEACQRIAQKLTQPKLQEVTAFIEKDDFASACKILLGYYDHYYNRGLDKRKNQEIFYLTLNGFDLGADVVAVIRMLEKFNG